MENKNVIRVNKQATKTHPNASQFPRNNTVPSVSKVSNSRWSKIAKKVLNENMGAWKALSKE
jgi:hypothetical protein